MLNPGIKPGVRKRESLTGGGLCLESPSTGGVGEASIFTFAYWYIIILSRYLILPSLPSHRRIYWCPVHVLYYPVNLIVAVEMVVGMNPKLEWLSGLFILDIDLVPTQQPYARHVRTSLRGVDLHGKPDVIA